MSFFKYWRQDAQSSLVTFLVALPLCLGIALASNAPLVSGLYAGVIGGILVGFLSGSHISVSGPAAGLAVIVINSLQILGTFEAFALAVFISGIIQIIFGFFKVGNLGNYFPTSVIKGMLAAIGIILILKQLPHAVGYDVDYMGDESFTNNGENTFTQLFKSFEMFSGGAVLISLISLCLMLGWEKGVARKIKFCMLIPGALIAVIVAILLNEYLGFIAPGHMVNLPFDGGVKAFFDGFKMPDWGASGNLQLYTVALTIAIVGSLESLLSLDAADKIDPQGRVADKNRELFAQGVGNTISGLIGGLPVTAVIVRTSANVTAGAHTKLSAILHGLLLALSAMAIPHVLNKIPLAVLAMVLIMVGYKLTKPELFKKMFAKGMDQFIPFVATILAILFTDLLIGIVIGLIVGFFFVIKTNVHKSIVLVSEGDLYLIKFYKDVSFVHKSTLLNMLNSIPDGASVLIDGSSSVFVDSDIEDLIEDYKKRAESCNTRITFKKSSLALSLMFKES